MYSDECYRKIDELDALSFITRIGTKDFPPYKGTGKELSLCIWQLNYTKYKFYYYKYGGDMQWFDAKNTIGLSFEEVLNSCQPDIQVQLLFNLDLFR